MGCVLCTARNTFTSNDTPYSSLAEEDVRAAIRGSDDVAAYTQPFDAAFSTFSDDLEASLIGRMMELSAAQEETAISNNIFARLANIPLIDRYKAYQLLDDEWIKISTDLETIQAEGFFAANQGERNRTVLDKVCVCVCWLSYYYGRIVINLRGHRNENYRNIPLVKVIFLFVKYKAFIRI